MKKRIQNVLSVIFLLVISVSARSNAQCTWHWLEYEGYEYTTNVPELVPGTTIHTVPQAFAVRTGSYSLYMNFVNTLAPGTLVYSRTIPVCPNIPVRISAYLATSFSGTQCNMRLEITDANNLTLADMPSLLAGFAPTWSLYQSGSVTPSTSTIKFKMYSNVGGSQSGNDLSVDDILVQQCNSLNLGADTTICNTASLTLDAGSGFASYLWNDNSTGQTLTASTTTGGVSTNSYFITVNDTNSCSFRDTIRITFTVCSEIEKDAESKYFSVYPNPAGSFFSISAEEEIASVEMYNLTGKKVKKISKGKNIYIGDLPSGNYFIKSETVAGKKYFSRVIVE